MIVFSPTKMMNNCNETVETTYLFNDQVNYLVNNINQLDIDSMGKMFKIKGKTLDTTYSYYQNFNNYHARAIDIYNGISFKQIEKYNENYVKDHVYILSTLYGISNGLDYISPYRLDFTITKVIDQNLYQYWKEHVNAFIKAKKTPLLNLASNEYAKMLSDELEIYEVDFTCSDKLTSVDLKKLRGHILNYCILNQIKDYKKLTELKTSWINEVKLIDNTFIFQVIPGSIMNK
jgi:cytoplasmic iron level regulating protein YaaA (DUF328/UPF0246 family)